MNTNYINYLKNPTIEADYIINDDIIKIENDDTIFLHITNIKTPTPTPQDIINLYNQLLKQKKIKKFKRYNKNLNKKEFKEYINYIYNRAFFEIQENKRIFEKIKLLALEIQKRKLHVATIHDILLNEATTLYLQRSLTNFYEINCIYDNYMKISKM